MHVDEMMATRFVCAKCRAQGAKTKRFAATGTGLSKLFDIQHNKFVAVSCLKCGYTEIYDPTVLEGRSNLGTVLDVLFGG
ncbi:zinc ribbon domain-containing protein [Candidatus Eisenbacteria bacterium]|uniref:Zinc ribbon domain-containing protein n=1 Tax=Eiseniibacteriota bacterium TaxID=2212470 RepID=A0ABV6YJI2_UNCEI